MAPNILNSDA